MANPSKLLISNKMRLSMILSDIWQDHRWSEDRPFRTKYFRKTTNLHLFLVETFSYINLPLNACNIYTATQTCI